MMSIVYKLKRAIPIAISTSIRESISKYYSIEINEIPLIYNGINIKEYIPRGQSNTEGENKKMIFCCVARLSFQKNHRMLISAFNIAGSKNKKMK